jgi:hemoglobin/transferrin/lactoferrin receptor protein
MFLIFIPVSIYSQTIRVVDKIDSSAIENATIKTKNRLVITNKSGTADLGQFSANDDFMIESIGYKPVSISFHKLQKTGFIVEMTSSMEYHLDEITISVVRWEDLQNGIPNHKVNIQARDISFSNVQTAADLLAQSHVVYMQKSQLGGGSPMIRGFSANRLLLVVDGVRMNNAIFRSGNLHNVISLDAQALESAEIISGPGSVVYGSDAIGGVMNFNTRIPQFGDKKLNISGEGLSRYSSANTEKTGHFHLNLGMKKWAFLTSLTFSAYSDLRMGSKKHGEYTRPTYVQNVLGFDSVFINQNKNVQKFTGYNQVNLMQKIRYNTDNKLDIVYGFHYSALSDVPRYDRLIEQKSNLPVFAEWYYGPQKWLMNSVNILYTAPKWAFDSAKITLAHQIYEESRNERRFRKQELRNKSENVKAFSANLDFFHKPGHKHEITYGFEFVQNLIQSNGKIIHTANNSIYPDASRYPNGSSYHAVAAYFSWKVNLSERLKFNSGFRYNYTNIKARFDTLFFKFPFIETTIHNTAPGGSIGMVYHPGTDWYLRLNLSKGFRTPNIDDIGKVFDSEPGKVVVPNPALKPESAWNSDLSIIRKLNDKGQFEIGLFTIWLRNAIVRRDYLFDGKDSIIYSGVMSRVQALTNTSKAYSYGFQFAFNYQIVRNVYFQTYFSITKGEEQDDQTGEYIPLRHAPPLFGSTHLLFQKAKFRAELYAIYNSEISNNKLAPSEKSKPAIYASDKNGQPYSPAWLTINLKISYLPVSTIQLNAAIENLADVRYRPYSSGIVAAGRNFIVSIKVHF